MKWNQIGDLIFYGSERVKQEFSFKNATKDNISDFLKRPAIIMSCWSKHSFLCFTVALNKLVVKTQA